MPNVDLLAVPEKPDSWRAYLLNNFRRVADAVALSASIVGSKDIEITDSTRGIVLRSPNGSRWRLQVTNAGTLTITAA